MPQVFEKQDIILSSSQPGPARVRFCSDEAALCYSKLTFFFTVAAVNEKTELR